MKFGKAIRKYRKKLEMKQAELAALAGVKATYICQLETGKAEPSLKLLRKFSEIFGVPEEILFWDSVEIPPNASKKDLKICQLAQKLVDSWH